MEKVTIRYGTDGRIRNRTYVVPKNEVKEVRFTDDLFVWRDMVIQRMDTCYVSMNFGDIADWCEPHPQELCDIVAHQLPTHRWEAKEFGDPLRGLKLYRAANEYVQHRWREGENYDWKVVAIMADATEE